MLAQIVFSGKDDDQDSNVQSDDKNIVLELIETVPNNIFTDGSCEEAKLDWNQQCASNRRNEWCSDYTNCFESAWSQIQQIEFGGEGDV